MKLMENNNALIDVQKRLKDACGMLELDESIYNVMKEPYRLMEVSIPVRMDDGVTKVFKGFRSSHSDSLGPPKAESGFIRESLETKSKRCRFGCH